MGNSCSSAKVIKHIDILPPAYENRNFYADGITNLFIIIYIIYKSNRY